MTLPPVLRKAALVAHVVSSVGWLGAVVVFLALAVTGVASDDEQTVRAAYVATGVAATYAVVPFAFVAVASGLVQSLGTHWGLVRHYWVVVKLVVSVAALAVLLLQLDSIRLLADAAARAPLAPADLSAARTSLVVHAAGGVLVLLVPTVLSVYKPRGVTRYGRRRAAAGGAVPVERAPA
ncbi:MAG TPA: hypothetical protein VNA20_00170 [Frankiaceae bacterium]|nr:hypothetical protein [Frankiaceae bacterium]